MGGLLNWFENLGVDLIYYGKMVDKIGKTWVGGQGGMNWLIKTQDFDFIVDGRMVRWWMVGWLEGELEK